MNKPKPSYVTVASILRPWGRRGEVAAEILTDFPERLTRLTSILLGDGHNEPHPVAIRACWLHNGQAIFQFDGSDSITEAERFVGLKVQIRLEERMPLPGGSYYVSDLVGCEVWERGGGRLGTVQGIQPTGEVKRGTPILEVSAPKGELLIPFAQEICVRIDPAARRIEVVLPEGLRDLNEIP